MSIMTDGTARKLFLVVVVLIVLPLMMSPADARPHGKDRGTLIGVGIGGLTHSG